MKELRIKDGIFCTYDIVKITVNKDTYKDRTIIGEICLINEDIIELDTFEMFNNNHMVIKAEDIADIQLLDRE